VNVRVLNDEARVADADLEPAIARPIGGEWGGVSAEPATRRWVLKVVFSVGP
jgi:hypothetical protein